MEEDKIDISPSLIVIGGSAGSLQPIFSILDALKPGFRTPILLVLHRVTTTESTLRDLLSVKTRMKVNEIEEKEAIRKGHLYICPADYHVLVEPDHSFSLDASEKINYSRPSIDVVFKSAAEIYRQQLTAVLLSGANADGVEGLHFAKQLGGTTIVQDPEDAVVAYMPNQALKYFTPDLVLDARGIAQALNKLA